MEKQTTSLADSFSGRFGPIFAPSTVMKYHYLAIAIAGNELSIKFSDIRKRGDIEPLMLEKYAECCDKINTLFPQLNVPANLNKETLMLSGGKPVDGKNLWRKFNETKGYIIRYCSPIWLMHSSSGASRADIIKNTLVELWILKEKDKIAKQGEHTPLAFDHDWLPKEWLAFLYCGIPAESNCLSVFQPNSSLHDSLEDNSKLMSYIDASASGDQSEDASQIGGKRKRLSCPPSLSFALSGASKDFEYPPSPSHAVTTSAHDSAVDQRSSSSSTLAGSRSLKPLSFPLHALPPPSTSFSSMAPPHFPWISVLVSSGTSHADANVMKYYELEIARLEKLISLSTDEKEVAASKAALLKHLRTPLLPPAQVTYEV